MTSLQSHNILNRFFDAVGHRYTLVSFGAKDCPVHCMAALPAEESMSDSSCTIHAADRKAPAGRGFTREQAALSCLGEAVELVSCSRWGDEAVIAGRDSVTCRTLALSELVLVSEQQFGDSEIWNERLAGFSRLPDDLSRLEAMGWLEAQNLTRADSCLVPVAYALIGDGGDYGVQHAYVGNSNGCAAAASWEEAVANGFLELVERDATAIWWYGQHQRPGVDVSGLSRCEAIIGWLRACGIDCTVIDISTDLELPVIAAVSIDDERTVVALGVAAAFDIQSAIEAAMTELVQQTLATMARQSAGSPGAGAATDGNPSRPVFLPDGMEPAQFVHFRQLARSRQIAPTIDGCVDLCQRHGLDLLVVDMTRRSLGVPVARTIVPGLRHTLPAFAPGRLYEVAARCRWPKLPTEDDLNRQPLVA